MRANPGGNLDPKDVLGRDRLIADLWGVLERQSVVLVSERRMGKTSVIKKMHAERPDGVLTFYQDLEGIRTPVEFVEHVFRAVEDHLSGWKKTAIKAREFLAQLGGGKVSEYISFPQLSAVQWKKLLSKIFEDLAAHQNGIVIMLWDELPLMIKNVSDNCGENAAMELLDTLRELRQTHNSIRMVFTGSVGLHNVVKSLRRGGYVNRPTNDMCARVLAPLDSDDACALAERLIQGEGLAGRTDKEVGKAIAGLVDRNAFYIHHVVGEMKHRHDVTWTASAVEALVTGFLTAAHDPWDLRHFSDRIKVYYTGEEQLLAFAALDTIAAAGGPMSFYDLFNCLKSAIVTEDKEKALSLLELLEQDHYLIKDAGGRYIFRFPLVERWWRLHRGLVK
jgi:hypothetical protein